MKKKISALLLTLTVIFGIIPNITYATAPVYLLAASDFQARDSEVPAENDIQSARNMSNILDKMESQGGYTAFDGLFFCGDYNQSTAVADASAGLAKIDALMDERYPTCTNRFYVQGNHDPAETVGLSPSGANDTADYGVFVIHEDEYPHNALKGGVALNASRQTAANLKTYLGAKIDAGYKKPIFIITHLPLHFNKRTNEKYNAFYGNLLFDVIDEAAECGLNIFYLFGHNHSGTYDYYLGNHAIYLKPGDEIVVSQGTQSDGRTITRTEKINFTYLNAGYVGYTSTRDSKELTMTVFKIEGNSVTVERFNREGRYNLKNAGGAISLVNDQTPVNRTVYESPQTVTLKTAADSWSVDWSYAQDEGYYKEDGTSKGKTRFLFGANQTRGKIKETGIVFIKPDGSEVSVPDGTASVFYADIYNIPLGIAKTYKAKAYCTVESGVFAEEERTFWSEIQQSAGVFSKFVK